MRMFSGKEYLLIDIANQYGMDKTEWSTRIDWVTANMNNLESLSVKAKHPILYRKAVRALRTVQRGEPTNHIMGLDAVSSGIQLMAVMSGCLSAARATNLIDTGVRRDLYTEMKQYMSKITGRTYKRKDVKYAVMTFYYGSTKVPERLFPETSVLEAFYEALQRVLPGPYALMVLFQKYWRNDAKYHIWTMPDGHVAKVPVVCVREKTIYLTPNNYAHSFLYRANVISPKKGRAMAANIVHSVDGYVVREMVRRATAQKFTLAPIHDCFYASPNYMNNVRKNYNKTLQSIIPMNLPQRILSEVRGTQSFIYAPDKVNSKKLHNALEQAEYPLS